MLYGNISYWDCFYNIIYLYTMLHTKYTVGMALDPKLISWSASLGLR